MFINNKTYRNIIIIIVFQLKQHKKYIFKIEYKIDIKFH